MLLYVKVKRGFENMKLQELLKNLHLSFPITGENPEITSIENDNRKVQKGSLFICIKGYTVDGQILQNQQLKMEQWQYLQNRPLPLDVPVIIVNDTTGQWLFLLMHFMNIQQKNCT